jgi:hypothetical protein
MNYDYMVAVHINHDGMVTGVPWRKHWRWRWDCSGEGRHENTPALCFDGHVAHGAWISGCASSESMHASVNSELCMYVKKDQHFQESVHVRPAWLTDLRFNPR